MVWFGINSAACLSSARAARAVMHYLSTALDSRSAIGGRGGKWFQGLSARQTAIGSIMSIFVDLFTAKWACVDAIDILRQRVYVFSFCRHIKAQACEYCARACAKVAKAPLHCQVNGRMLGSNAFEMLE